MNKILNTENGYSFCDAYEHTMAFANFLNNSSHEPAVFQTFLRRMPVNQIIGEFERNGVKYAELKKRDYLINAGLELIINIIKHSEGMPELVDYVKDLGLNHPLYLDWLTNLKFKGDIYAIEEGVPVFTYEPQIRIHSDFDHAQLLETIILQAINRQTAVASSANDITQVSYGKTLLEGASRRGTDPYDAIQISRAAAIGGFHKSSYIGYGLTYDVKVGGTMGHSYVLKHPTERDAFEAQIRTWKTGVVFLLDTKNVSNAIDTALELVEKWNLSAFEFRLDSGDLNAQAQLIIDKCTVKNFRRYQYKIGASNDLNPHKISELQKNNLIDWYLVGTFLTQTPNPTGIVYKLCSKGEEEIPVGKRSEETGKMTYGGITQVYRVSGSNGKYSRDIIGIQNQSLNEYIKAGETVEPLLKPIIKKGQLVYKFPTIKEISEKRHQSLNKFTDIENYPIEFSTEFLKIQQNL